MRNDNASTGRVHSLFSAVATAAVVFVTAVFALCLVVLPADAPPPSTPAMDAPLPPALPAAPRDLTGLGVECRDLSALESAALIGRLSEEQIACLHASFPTAVEPADQKKVSLLLIANAHGSGDRDAWERLILRHLEVVDVTDPNITYAYATHVARKGPERARDVIRWAEVSLENRDRWRGDTYQHRVYGLYKLRAASANTIWQRTLERADVGRADEAEVRRARGRVQEMAREWLVFSETSGRNSDTPRQLCLALSEDAAFCDDRSWVAEE